MAAAAGLRWTLLTTALLFLTNAGLGGAASNHGHPKWSYNDAKADGPASWPTLFKQCAGHHQSPVDLGDPVENDGLPELDLRGYDRPLKGAWLTNNGHSAQINFPDSFSASLSGGCLHDTYDLAQVHFHWGSIDGWGSEHTVAFKPFSMEGHLVHMNRKYPNTTEAVKHTDGLAVLGVFYQAVGGNASHLDPLVGAVEEAARSGIDVKVKGRLADMTLRALLPDDTTRFYCYRHGSLTTPHCNQAVTWTVLADTCHIGKRQVSSFRKLTFDDGSPMVNNFRPVQPLNGRTIYFRSSSRNRVRTRRRWQELQQKKQQQQRHATHNKKRKVGR